MPSFRSRKIERQLLVLAIAGLSLATLEPRRVRADLIVNGGFEQPAVPTNTFGEEFNAGSTLIIGWSVLSGSVDIEPPFWYAPYQGVQALDLDGSVPGAISQTFATTIGTAYQLSFAYADNGHSGVTYSGNRTANVSVTDAAGSSLLSLSVSHNGSTTNVMNYDVFTANFVADTTTATLQFTSTDPSYSNGGIVLDAVSVNLAVPEPGPFVLLGLGMFGSMVYGGRRTLGTIFRR